MDEINEEAKVKRLEFRPDHKGRFDEITARFSDGMVHVETMSKTGCYVGFYWDDGTYCQWWISSDKKLCHHHESGNGDPPKFDAWGRPNALILPDPKDPLEEIFSEHAHAHIPTTAKAKSDWINARLEERGLQITPIEGSK